MKEIAEKLVELCSIVEAKKAELDAKEFILSARERDNAALALELDKKEESLRDREIKVSDIEDLVEYRAKSVELNAQNTQERNALDQERAAFNIYVAAEKSALAQQKLEASAEIKRLSDLKAERERENIIEQEVAKRVALLVKK